MSATTFEEVYSVFYSKITDDMYSESMTSSDTEELLGELLENAISWFEFPKQDLSIDTDNEEFISELTREEIQILATYMVISWIDQYLANIDTVRMIYTGADFKMTSQANHMAKLQSLKEKYTTEGFHLQRLYKRRRLDKNGIQRSTMDTIMKPLAEGEWD